ncbi:DUF2786 domain-containing protein [Corynebacterium crudilactis]|uniref:Uncharacterized protein n=1 Tax=Corynebacterium crudilactis TaxID=1652495 RepID=A0A172QXL3_9CORY|nr:DUF2786 domain-containing protein [Corynebacterium crudilactis]ANE05447.1 hypothetical protein ccrud_13990 [Corynebacterium crudilactis]
MSQKSAIERKIRGLLAKAADQEGTPEGDAFQAKAFELMAHYGVEESQVNGDESSQLIAESISLGGAHTPMQFRLLSSISEALSCTIVGTGNGRKITKVTIFGRRRHVERVMMLFTILNPQMATGATKAAKTANNPWGETTAVLKRSWMRGFIYSIGQRLKNIEKTVVEEATAQGTGTEISLVDDLRAAEEMAEKEHPDRKTLTTRARYDAELVQKGSDSAENTDIGQTRINKQPVALTA